MPACLAVLTTLVAKAKAANRIADKVAALGRRNDNDAAAEFAEMRDEIVVESAQSITVLSSDVEDLGAELAEVRAELREFSRMVVEAFPEWAERETEECPTSDDVQEALLRYRVRYQAAGSHAKRKLLFSSLIGGFSPAAYDGGWSMLFEKTVAALEPPHVELLARLCKFKRWEKLDRLKVDGFLVDKLVAERLVFANESQIIATGVAERFLDFLWGYDEPRQETAGS